MSDSTKNILEWIYCIVIAIVLALLIKFFFRYTDCCEAVFDVSNI